MIDQKRNDRVQESNDQIETMMEKGPQKGSRGRVAPKSGACRSGRATIWCAHFLASTWICFSMGGCQSDEGSKVQSPPVVSNEKPDHRWRAQKPPAQPMAEMRFPKFEMTTLPNGLEVWVSENHHLPITDAAFVTRVGSSQESSEKAGLASMTFGTLSEGTQSLDSYALHDAFQQLGTRLSVSVDREGGRISMSILKRNLSAGMALLKDVILSPSFAEDGFERVKKKRLTYIQSRLSNPRARAADAFLAVTYGEDHPYGKPAYGTEKSLNALRVADVKAFWSTQVVPSNSALILTGNIRLQEAKEIAETLFGHWGKPPVSIVEPEMPPLAKPMIHLIPSAQNATQTVMFFGRPLTRWSDGDDIYSSSVMNQILGGMFSSRLNLNLREDKGWTYGAMSEVTTRRGPGPFYATSSIKAEHGPAAILEFLGEFKRMREEPVSQAELQNAKDNAIKSLPSKFETVTALSYAAEELFKNQLPLDFFKQIPNRIATVTAEDVQTMAKRALSEDGLTMVLVGDAEKTSAGIRELNLAREIKIWEDASSAAP